MRTFVKYTTTHLCWCIANTFYVLFVLEDNKTYCCTCWCSRITLLLPMSERCPVSRNFIGCESDTLSSFWPLFILGFCLSDWSTVMILWHLLMIRCSYQSLQTVAGKKLLPLSRGKWTWLRHIMAPLYLVAAMLLVIKRDGARERELESVYRRGYLA